MNCIRIISFVAAIFAAAPLAAKSLVLSIDLSESNPVITSERFAKVAAEHAHREVVSTRTLIEGASWHF